MIEIRRLDETSAAAQLEGLAAVLHDCVEGGASVSFMAPFAPEDAVAFFRSILGDVADGSRILLAAFDGETLVGTAQVLLTAPANQPHRAEIAKVLVHRTARGNGVGAALMQQAEREAGGAGKSLLVLDTVTGDAGERLYARLGWVRVGEIPGYALYPDGRPCATTVFYKNV